MVSTGREVVNNCSRAAPMQAVAVLHWTVAGQSAKDTAKMTFAETSQLREFRKRDVVAEAFFQAGKDGSQALLLGISACRLGCAQGCFHVATD